MFFASMILMALLAGCAFPAVSVEKGGVSVTSDQNETIKIKLGPGNCLKEDECRAYCEKNLQECIEWCTQNEHYLCGAIVQEYLD